MKTCPTCQNDLVCHDIGECLRPTPAVDARQRVVLGGVGGDWKVVDADFARRLERERDEAREQLSSICLELFDNDDTIGGESAADYVIRQVTKEREVLRGLIQRAVSDLRCVRCLDASDTEFKRAALDLLEQAIKQGGQP